jgi:class 3 adenylate cyclase
MDAPPVQYLTTDDGVRLAYSVAGTGVPLVFLPNETLSMSGRWEVPQIAAFYERLGSGRQLITYDRRGMGLSDRVAVATLDEAASDLRALVDALELETFDIFSSRDWIGLVLAGSPGDRVRRLVLWEPMARTAYMFAGPGMDMTRRMVEGDWETYWQAMLRFLNMPSEYADLWARSIPQTEYRRMIEIGIGLDVTSSLDSVKSETLVIHHADSEWTPLDSIQEIASKIRGARLVQFPGSPYVPWLEGSADAVLDAVLPFLAESDAPTQASGLQTILFTDLESSTALTQRLGDEGAQELLRGHNETVRAALEEHGSREVKHTGDGIMASFPSAVSAVTAALAMQRDLAGGEVRVRVGLNAGEPIAEDNDLFGTAVQLAARITDRAEPGQVLVSNVVRELCAGKTFEFTSVGDATLKGFDEPVALYQVRAR